MRRVYSKEQEKIIVQDKQPNSLYQKIQSDLYKEDQYCFIEYPPHELDPMGKIWVPISQDVVLSLEEYNDLFPERKFMGRGTYGAVYCWKTKKEIKNRIEQQVVIKISEDIPVSIAEYSLLKALEGIPHIIPVYGFETKYIDEKHQKAYIYLKYCEGGDLSEYIESFKTKEDKTELHLCFYKLLRTLHQVHKRGIIHRDLTVYNILLCKGEPYIIDWGLSTYYHISKFTRLSHQVQTFPYRSPEVFDRSFHYSEKIDVWSLGIIFLQVLRQNKHSIFYAENDKASFRLVMQYFHLPQKLSYRDVWTFLVASKKEWPLQITLEDKEQEYILRRMLHLNPYKRADTTELLEHPYFKQKETVEMEEENEMARGTEIIEYTPIELEEEWRALLLPKKMNLIRWLRQMCEKYKTPLIWTHVASLLIDSYLSDKKFGKKEMYFVGACIMYLFALDHFHYISLSVWCEELDKKVGIALTEKQFFLKSMEIYASLGGHIFYRIPATDLPQVENTKTNEKKQDTTLEIESIQTIQTIQPIEKDKFKKRMANDFSFGLSLFSTNKIIEFIKKYGELAYSYSRRIHRLQKYYSYF